MADEALRLGTGKRRLDPEALQGIEKECPYRRGLTVTILPAAGYNPRFRRAVQSSTLASLRNGGRTPETIEEAEDELTEDVLARYYEPDFVVDAFVADMDGLYNGKGNAVKYTKERGRAILSDPHNADVLHWIVGVAQRQAEFYTEAVEEDAGN